ncbi:MAG: AAA family ATPase, partial [Bacteroidia bacterium]|nr:AAA family ATPase [Bacteroidia bacterium]
MIHAHVALEPLPVPRINADVPEAVSAIVQKLMAKNAEDRYQSAEGLARDLEFCLDNPGALDGFVAGRFDAPREFRLPQKLYGREDELGRLFEAFERVCATGESAVLTIAGVSGAGKSALINEIQKPLARERGYFVAGKCDQYRRNVPFDAVAQALRELVRRILTESPESVARWKAEISAALGTNAKAIAEVVPELEWLLGPLPEAVPLSGVEALNRAEYLFEQFVKLFAKREHPLVMFLDDVQWADSASLKWLEGRATAPAPNYLMLVCAYRDNEVGDDHPLRAALKNIAQSKAVTEIKLRNLTAAQIERLLDDALDGGPNDEGRHAALAELILRKTAGNPFFVGQFLVRLHDEGILRWSAGRWEYDFAAVESVRSSDNVVEFLSEKLRLIPARSREVLQAASVLGVEFDENVVAQILDEPLPEIRERLNKLSGREWIVKTGDVFRFLHDRV